MKLNIIERIFVRFALDKLIESLLLNFELLVLIVFPMFLITQSSINERKIVLLNKKKKKEIELDWEVIDIVDLFLFSIF